MAKLPRITAKIFASKANPDDIGQFGSALSGTKVNTGDIAKIQALPAFEEGWRDAVISKRNYPTLQETNGQQKVAFQQIAYTLQTGIPEWDADTEYFANTSFCQVDGVWYQSLTDNNIGNNPAGDTTNWKEISFNGSGFSTALPLFSPVLQDHILTYEESKGYALQGTYVYKESAPERYGYPDFYNTCLKEYQNSEQVVIAGVDINQPVFTSNTEDGITISDSRGNTTVLQALMNGTNAYNQIGLWSTYWINIDYNEPTLLKNYTIKADSYGTAEYPTAWTVQGTNDGETFEVLDSQSGIAFTLGQSLTFEISEQKTTYRQYRLVFSDGVLSSGTAHGELSKVTFEAKSAYNVLVNSNGHVFYNISDKEVIDKLFEQKGVAWYYGVDEENERIFLPRDNYFAIKNIAPVVGNGNVLGINVPQQGRSYQYLAQNELQSSDTHAVSVFGLNSTTPIKAGSTGGTYYNNNSKYGIGVTTNPDLSGIETHLQPDDTKYLYIVVGNTEQTQSITDITEVTTSENDTIPLGYSCYQGDGTQASVAFLASKNQWNSGKIYTTFYNYYVNKIGDEFASGYIKESSEDYDDYDLVINQDDMTFRLPLLNGSENLPGDKVITILTNTQKELLNSTYTAPKNGYLTITNDSAIVSVSVVNSQNKIGNEANGGESVAPCANIFLKKGETATYTKSPISVDGSTTHVYFTPAKGNGTLYFKVANAVENLELLDAGKVLESLADKVDKDSDLFNGQWVFEQMMLTNSTAATQTLDLSDYLPKDEYDYEVMFTVNAYTSSTSDQKKWIYTDILPHNTDWSDTWNNANTRHSANSFICPVGKERKVYVGGSTVESFYLYVKGYRRLGKKERVKQ